MPTSSAECYPHWSGLAPISRRLFTSGLRLWSLSPWAALALAGLSVARHRWPGALGVTSALACALSAWGGWWLVWRVAEREVDVAVAQALLQANVSDPPPWSLFAPREELIKAAHWSWCLERHGVNPRSSGWERLAASRGWGELGAALLLCVPLALHPWWVL